jgi:release factor glutamine methyltransferase
MSGHTIGEVVERAAQDLLQLEAPHLEAECLLSAILQVDRLFLKKYPEKPVDMSVLMCLQDNIRARKTGYPLAYLLGKKAFWTFEVSVTPAVLIPRPETERLVEVVLEKLPQWLPYPVLELGTGSGAIALALALERPKWQVIATDCSLDALQVAKKNAEDLQVSNIRFYQGNWFEAVAGQGPFSAIVSNPPYIAKTDPHLLQAALQAEPSIALCPGDTGLEAYQILIEQAKEYLEPKGLLCLEHGYDQSDALFSFLAKNGYHKRQQFFDLSGIPRVILAGSGELDPNC